MNNNNLNTDTLLEYLDNELSVESKRKLEAQMEDNTELQQELEHLVLAKGAVKSYGMKQHISNIHKEMMAEMGDSKTTLKEKGIVRRMVKFSMKIAASVLIGLICLGVYQYTTVSDDKVFNNNYDAYTLNTSRSATDNTTIEKLYQEKNYESVINLYAAITDASAKEIFLVGMSFMEIKNYSKAIESFNKVLAINKTNQSTNYMDDAQYFLAMSYLKSSIIKSAYPIFEAIKNNKEHLYNDKMTTRFMYSLWLLKIKN